MTKSVKPLFYLMVLLLSFSMLLSAEAKDRTIAPFDYGQLSGGGAMSGSDIADSLDNAKRNLVNNFSITKPTSATSDTALAIYWADTNAVNTNRPALLINMDVTDHTAANTKVSGLIFAGTAFNDYNDNFIYKDSENKWRGDGNLYAKIFTTDGQVLCGDAAANFNLQHKYSHDIVLDWQANSVGDVILRDGNLGVANPDFFQIQDSSGAVQLQISNAGDIKANGNINSGIVIQNVLGAGFNYDAISLNQNGGDNTFIGFNHIVSADSLILDSVIIVWRAQEADSNVLDSIYLGLKSSLTEGLLSTALWSDGTDKTAQADGYNNVAKWTGINTKIAPWDFFIWYICCDHTAASGDVSIRNWVAFYSY